MRSFEDKLVDSMGDAFSPLRMWSTKERAKCAAWTDASAKTSSGIANQLNRWAHVYCYLDSLEEHPSALGRFNFGELRQHAAEEMPAKEDDEEEAEEEVAAAAMLGLGRGKKDGKMRKKARKSTWFERACEIANKKVVAHP